MPVRPVPVISRCPRSPGAVIRVASVPSGHVYVQHLAPLRADPAVRRLPDPPPATPHPADGQWWPPGALSRAWIEEHADEFDIFHVHFGFDAMAAGELDDIVDALSERGKPLVYTVHDLRNPHHLTTEAHEAHLDVLVPRAAALITLTPGAAAEIERRWGRPATVIPHPHVVDLARMGRPRGEHDGFVVGVHGKSARANMALGPVLRGLLPLVGELPGLRLQVNLHHDVADVDGLRHDAALMRLLSEAKRAGLARLRVHDCFSDVQLWDYLQSLDLSVLPYRFGTHSGWLEACRDLGTTVLAPTCGYFAEQQPCLTYGHDENGLDVASLQATVQYAYRKRPAGRATVAERSAQRDAIAAAHRALYEQVLT